MPVEFRLEFVAVVGADFADPEWEFFDDVVCEIDGVGLRVLVIDFESANAGCVVDSGILEAPDLLFTLAAKVRTFISI